MLIKRITAIILLFILLSSSVPAFADRGGRGGPGPGNFHGDFRPDHVVHRVPPGYISLMVGSLAMLYCEGLFYRYTPAGYVVVTPPMGAVVPALPPGYTTVISNGVPYYYFGYTYYTAAPNGYAVAAPPVAPALPQVVQPVATVASAPVAQPVAVSTVPVSAATARPALYPSKEEELNRDVYEIYIPNGNGSYTSVTLRKTEKGFLGPQGEFYEDHPTIEQLRERYTKK